MRNNVACADSLLSAANSCKDGNFLTDLFNGGFVRHSPHGFKYEFLVRHATLQELKRLADGYRQFYLLLPIRQLKPIVLYFVSLNFTVTVFNSV
jgi:hypothetical protein